MKLPRRDDFYVLILDDIGYVQQVPEEGEVLFTLSRLQFSLRLAVWAHRLRQFSLRLTV